MEAYPKPRHKYLYQPRYGQRGILTYAGQAANGAVPTGAIPNASMGYGVGVGTSMGVAPTGYYPSRTYYNTVPTYGYGAQAYVYPPGQTGTTTTTTRYQVTNSHAGAAHAVHHSTPATCSHGATREDIQMENRRIATERGAYSARRIKPADARDDDPFWCRERNGEWHLRSYYQIENECHPGRWMMDADQGFLVFHRD